jgi:hypothetical protein
MNVETKEQVKGMVTKDDPKDDLQKAVDNMVADAVALFRGIIREELDKHDKREK